MLSTRALAAASARHPWRVLAAWLVVTLTAFAAIALLLGGSLTTEGRPTNDPESLAAEEARFEAFPPDPAGWFFVGAVARLSYGCPHMSRSERTCR